MAGYRPILERSLMECGGSERRERIEVSEKTEYNLQCVDGEGGL